jgi:hypothetical protein
VRTYILVLVLGILLLSPVLTAAILIHHMMQQVPLRRATFLTLANAVRGPSWDASLRGGCVMPDDMLRKRYRGERVMYGVDEYMPSHVGFAPRVAPVQRNKLYAGVDQPAQYRILDLITKTRVE